VLALAKQARVLNSLSIGDVEKNSVNQFIPLTYNFVYRFKVGNLASSSFPPSPL